MNEFIDLLLRYHQLFLEGLRNTLLLTITSYTFGFLIGLPVALMRVYGVKPLKVLALIYVELIRGTPMLLQLFIIYFALPQLGIVLDPVTAAFLGIGINSGAYQAEYLRGALRSVPQAQWEAALSIGMTKAQVLGSIIVPQALRVAIPALANEFIYLLKYSSVAYFITVVELVYAGKIVGSATFKYLEVYTLIAVIYLALGVLFMKLFRELEFKLAIPGLSPLKSERMY